MIVTVQNDYYQTEFTTATFDLLLCENYYGMFESTNFTLTPGISSGDLTLNLLTDSSAEISWTTFTYDYIPCDVRLYNILCLGPDQK